MTLSVTTEQCYFGVIKSIFIHIFILFYFLSKNVSNFVFFVLFLFWGLFYVYIVYIFFVLVF